MQSFALLHGYGIKKGRSGTIGNRTGAEIKNIGLLCVHGGKHKPKDNRVRKTTTARTDCPFKVNIKHDDYGEWIVEVKNGSQNHNAMDNIAAYPSTRTLTEEKYQIAKQMSKAGVELVSRLSLGYLGRLLSGECRLL
jgi:hypothetical protein